MRCSWLVNSEKRGRGRDQPFSVCVRFAGGVALFGEINGAEPDRYRVRGFLAVRSVAVRLEPESL